MLYLDHNSTTPLLPEVASAMAECQAGAFANPSSQHAAGRRARQVIEDARDRIAELLGLERRFGREDKLIFTSGGTESNNLAILGLAGESPGRLVISPMEHHSVSGAAERLARCGWKVDRLPINRQGVVDVDQLAGLLTPETRLVSIMLANHETGALQPLHQIAELCSAAGVLVHTDAVQAVGKLPVNFRELGVAALSIGAHKFHGPRGIGALALRHGMQLQPQLQGGFQQWGLRPGTEPTALVVGMCRALELWAAESTVRIERLTAMRNRFEAALQSAIPDLVVNASAAPRLPHTSNVAFPGLERQALLMALDLAGVACSTGAACASGSTDPSPTLAAMGCPDDVLGSSLRFSFGATTTTAEVEQGVERITRVVNELRNRPGGRKIAGSSR